MQGYYTPCPHCRNQLFDDGRFAGKLVQCPTCRQQFQMPIQAKPVMPNVVVPVQDPFAFCSQPTTSASRYVKPRSKPTFHVWGFVVGAIVLLVSIGLQQYGKHLQQTDSNSQNLADDDNVPAGLSSTEKGMYLALKRKLGNAEAARTFDKLMDAKYSGVNIYSIDTMSESDFLQDIRGIPMDQQRAAISLRCSGWKSGAAAKTRQK